MAQTPGGQPPRINWAVRVEYQADGPHPIDLAGVPKGVFDPNHQLAEGRGGNRIESPLSREETDLLREQSKRLPASVNIQFPSQSSSLQAPATGASFDSLDANDCCGGGLNVPPDSELAVGPNHIIAVVNVAFEIYDKSGNVLSGPTTFSSFFAGTPGCSSTGVFDPNVLYDEAEDRFILGIDGDGTDYCVAASQGPDPMGLWNRYGFPTDIGGAFFDYPHAGVGLDAIYVGSNQFLSGFLEGRVFAIDKFALYDGTLLMVKSRSTESTPQPMNLHGFLQGTWPSSGPHYIMTEVFDGANHTVWSWDDPFGADVFTRLGDVNLNLATGVTAGFPVDVPQAGSSDLLQANDWRGLDTEYRNGNIWMTNTIACNPGGGTVDCVRWAQIDPTGPTVLDAGVFATPGDYRFFPDLAVNDCDDMAVGYTKSSSGIFPSVWMTGRESGDTPGTLQSEVLVKAGEIPYDSFQRPGPHRWGDYSGMTIDPDGQTFWYLGEYSKDINNFNTTTWGNFIGSFSYPSCAGPSPPGKAGNPGPGNGATNVDIDADLSWTPGSGADSHDVYFGASPSPGPGEFLGNQAGSALALPTLSHNVTHYWRIDEVNGQGTTTGDVWSFTTAEEVQPDVVIITLAEYKADRDELKIRATSSEQPAPVLTVVGYGQMRFKKGRYELKIRPLSPLPIPSTVTVVSSFGGSDTSAVQGAPAPPTPGQAGNPNPADGANNVSVNATVSWTAGSNTDSHDVYFGTNPNPGAGEFQGNQAGTSFDPGGLTNNTTYYWAIDEVNGNGTTAGDVWSFTTEPLPGPPGMASNPLPVNGAIGVAVDVILSWTAGSGASTHDVYFGTCPTPGFQANQGTNSFDPGTLAFSTTYCWAIDEVNGFGTTPGDTWSFTTVDEPAGDVITITKAEWKAGRQELKVTATSSAQPDAVLTLVGFGEMKFRKNKYEFKKKPLANPGTVTVTSSLGGSATATVVIR